MVGRLRSSRSIPVSREAGVQSSLPADARRTGSGHHRAQIELIQGLARSRWEGEKDVGVMIQDRS